MSVNWVEQKLLELERTLRLRRLRRSEKPQPGVLRFDSRDYVNFGSNDYLALSAEPRVVKAFMLAAEQAGVGAGASRLISGNSREHELLEEELADFFGFESCLLFSSGYLANLGVLSALLTRHSAVFADREIHASLIDGLRLSQAKHYRFRHNDLNHLEDLLKVNSQLGRMKLIVSESIFSMDGSGPDIKALLFLAEKYAAMLLLDEAHAIGVFGEGRGRLIGEFNSDAVIKTANLSKALGGAGGFVLSSKKIRNYLISTARSFIFNTALPLPQVQAARKALELVKENPTWGIEVLGIAELLRSQLSSQGLGVGQSISQIIPCMIPTAEAALRAERHLLEQGFYAPAIRHPSVPLGQERLRFSLCRGQRQAVMSLPKEILPQP